VVDAITGRPFDLATDIPVRAALVDVDGDAQVLVVVVHHIAGDGWSMGPLLRDLAAAYVARSAGAAPQWTELPVQYADYTLWQRTMLGDAADPDSQLSRQSRFWAQALAGAPALLDLPTDHPRRATTSQRGAVVPVSIDAETHRRLGTVAQRCGATLFMVLQSAFAVVLSRWGAGTDIPIGTVVAGRDDEALDGLVGFFVNTLVLRTDLSGNPTFAELVGRVRDADLAAYAHTDLPFERLVEQLNPHRSTAYHPLTQVTLVLQTATGAVPTGSPLHGRELPVDTGTAKFELTLAVRETDAGLRGVIEYATDLFTAETVEALADRLVRLLSTVVADDGQHIEHIDLRGTVEQEWERDGADGVPRAVEPWIAELAAARGLATDGPVRPHLLDERLRPVPIGVPGELYLTGMAGGEPGRGLYRTGILARWTATGRACPLGPVADRARVGGLPVRLSVVEAAIGRHPAVTRAAAVVREDRLVVYVVGRVDPAELRRYAERELPDYLVPAAVVPLDALPERSDGEVDREALPAPEEAVAQQAVRDRSPRNPHEELLVGVFAELLDGRPVGLDDNFFRIGGHSLLAVRAVNRIRAATGAELTIRDLFQRPTVTGFAELLAERAGAGAARPTLRRRTAAGARVRSADARSEAAR
jgi:aryl carrier-like protein